MIMLQRLCSLKDSQHRSPLHQLKVEGHKCAAQESGVREDEVQEAQDEVQEAQDEVQEAQGDEVQEAQGEVQEDVVQEDVVQEDVVQEVIGVVGEIILEMNSQMNFLKKYCVLTVQLKLLKEVVGLDLVLSLLLVTKRGE
jgi:hypothetical protein